MPVCSACKKQLPYAHDFVSGAELRGLYQAVVCLNCGWIECTACKGDRLMAPCPRCGGQVTPATVEALRNTEQYRPASAKPDQGKPKNAGTAAKRSSANRKGTTHDRGKGLAAFFARLFPPRDRKDAPKSRNTAARYPEMETKSPQKAVTFLLRKALPATAVLSDADFQPIRDRLKRRGEWTEIIQGSEEKTKAALLEYLGRIVQSPKFHVLDVRVLEAGKDLGMGRIQEPVVAIYCNYGTYFHGIWIWKLENRQFVVNGIEQEP